MREKDQMKKLLAAAAAVFLLAACVCAQADASEKDRISDAPAGRMLDELDYGDVNEALEEIFPQEAFDFKKTVADVISGRQQYSAELAGKLIAEQIVRAFADSRRNLVHILLLSLLAALFHNFSQIFRNRQISETGFYILFLLIVALCLDTLGMVTGWVESGVHKLTSFMTVFCPLYFLAVSVAKGSVTATAYYHLALLFICAAEMIVAGFLLPAIHIYMMVRLLDHLTSQEYLSRLADLMRTVITWTLRTLLACAAGLNIVQGMLGPAIDTVRRSAVTRTAEAIPGVGNVIGGTAEVVLGTAVLVKNGIGIVGGVVCAAICAVPLIQVGCIALMYRFAAAVIQPVSDKRAAGCVECVGDGCGLLMQVLFTVGILFLLTVVIVSFVTAHV